MSELEQPADLVVEPTEPVVTPEPAVVEKARLDRAVDEVHKYKSRVKELEMAAALDAEKKLKESENWKELATKYEQRALTAEEKSDKVQQSWISSEKFADIKARAMRHGLLPEAVDDLAALGTDEVEVETTSTGRINVLGGDAWVEKIKMLKPHYFSGQRVPNVNTTTVGLGQPEGPVDLGLVRKLERESKKTGDTTAYNLALKKYQQQKMRG